MRGVILQYLELCSCNYKFPLSDYISQPKPPGGVAFGYPSPQHRAPNARFKRVRVQVSVMTLTRKQEMVLAAIFDLGRGDPARHVIISAVHHSFSDMDVSDLVVQLGALIDTGLIANAKETSERIGNVYVITPEGLDYHHRHIRNDTGCESIPTSQDQK